MSNNSGPRGRGHPPIPLWIDGVEYSSTADAKAELKVHTKLQVTEFKAALQGDGIYNGHRISREPNDLPPPPPPVEFIPSGRASGGPLLPILCTSRLGVYRGEGW